MPPDPRQGQAAAGGALRAALTRVLRHGEGPVDDEGDAFVVKRRSRMRETPRRRENIRHACAYGRSLNGEWLH
jgi:hypothetical protein